MAYYSSIYYWKTGHCIILFRSPFSVGSFEPGRGRLAAIAALDDGEGVNIDEAGGGGTLG